MFFVIFYVANLCMCVNLLNKHFSLSSEGFATPSQAFRKRKRQDWDNPDKEEAEKEEEEEPRPPKAMSYIQELDSYREQQLARLKELGLLEENQRKRRQLERAQQMLKTEQLKREEGEKRRRAEEKRRAMEENREKFDRILEANKAGKELGQSNGKAGKELGQSNGKATEAIAVADPQRSMSEDGMERLPRNLREPSQIRDEIPVAGNVQWEKSQRSDRDNYSRSIQDNYSRCEQFELTDPRLTTGLHSKQAEAERRLKEAEIERRSKEAEIERQSKEAEIDRQSKQAEIERQSKEAESQRHSNASMKSGSNPRPALDSPLWSPSQDAAPSPSPLLLPSPGKEGDDYQRQMAIIRGAQRCMQAVRGGAFLSKEGEGGEKRRHTTEERSAEVEGFGRRSSSSDAMRGEEKRSRRLQSEGMEAGNVEERREQLPPTAPRGEERRSKDRRGHAEASGEESNARKRRRNDDQEAFQTEAKKDKRERLRESELVRSSGNDEQSSSRTEGKISDRSSLPSPIAVPSGGGEGGSVPPAKQEAKTPSLPRSPSDAVGASPDKAKKRRQVLEEMRVLQMKIQQQKLLKTKNKIKTEDKSDA